MTLNFNMRPLNALLIQPWITDFTAYDLYLVPLGFLRIARWLQLNQIKVHYIDCLDRSHPSIKDRTKSKKYGTGKFYYEVIPKPRVYSFIPRLYKRYGIPIDAFKKELEKVDEPDFILITSTMTYWYEGVQIAISILKEKFPSIPIILGGTYATLCYEHAKNNSGADYVCKGPAEYFLPYWLSKHLKFEINPLKPTEYLRPAWELINHKFYSVIRTTIGCPHNCPYCGAKLIHNEFNLFPISEIIDELKWHKIHRKVKDIAFVDDDLLHFYENHFKNLLLNIVKSKLRFRFHTPNAIDFAHLNQELIELMKKVGFVEPRLSLVNSPKFFFESDNNRKKISYLKKYVDYFIKAGFKRNKINVYLIFGMPEQKLEQIINAMLVCFFSGFRIMLSFFSPVPGTIEFEKTKSLITDIDSEPLLHNKFALVYNHPNWTPEDFEFLTKFQKTLNIALDFGINNLNDHIFNSIKNVLKKFI